MSAGLSEDDTIAAIATPPGKGAIAIVRVSGPGVPELARRALRTKSDLRARFATRATILDERDEPLDEGLAILFPAPHSYTGDQMLELHLHGSPVVAREVVRALLVRGARLAQPGEFTRRAFLNGKMDLHAAAAVADVIDAETRSAARAALANLGGALAEEIRALRGSLASALEELAGAIDFPDEVAEPDRQQLQKRLSPILASLERLRHDGEIGRLIREGVPVAIVGPPNAGKSSLLNALLGTDRAIVSEIPGTTRDTIEESLLIDGVPVRIVDTAGIRTHADRLEGFGIARTLRALDAARIALLVIDGSQRLGSDAASLLEQTNDRDRILFFNKADLGTRGACAIGAPRDRRQRTRRENRRSPAACDRADRLGRRTVRRLAPTPNRAPRVRRSQRSDCCPRTSGLHAALGGTSGLRCARPSARFFRTRACK